MSFFEQLLAITKSKEISGLTDELKALYLTNYYKKNKKGLLLVTSSLYEANLFYQMVRNYTTEVLFFPMDDFLTSEALATSPELMINRLETLKELVKDGNKIVITNLMGYLRYLPDVSTYKESFITLHSNQTLSIEDLVQKLFRLGYKRQSVVNKTGEIAVRGFVVDIFPLGYENPIRIEYWGDEIDTIRTFNVNTQLTIEQVSTITLYPITEFLCTKECPFEEQKQKNLPLYENVCNIKSYLNNATVFYYDFEQLETSYKQLLQQILDYNSSLDIKSNTSYMFDFYDLSSNRDVYLSNFDNKNFDDCFHFISREIEPFTNSIEEINKRLSNYLKNGQTVIICLTEKRKLRKLERELGNTSVILTNEENIFENHINLIEKEIYRGFGFENYIVISEYELFQKNEPINQYKSKFKLGTKIRDLKSLMVGDYVVHYLCGIGQYIGIKTIEKNGLKKDYLNILYCDDDHLYIPVEKIELISKYSQNGGGTPKLNKLSSNEWKKTKERVRKKIESIAGELLELYAKRESLIGFSCEKDNEVQREFENEFIYEETRDQLKVIEEIKRDMESPHPMDRLLCGDVGYGKTEVAFRAMMKAVLNNRQVAFLCPTTILSNQHYENAKERFQKFPVRIALLNRFTSPKKVKEILENLKNGTIDILIGTHRILSHDIVFQNLGLLVIDEEQRFGVKHKEQIKQYKNMIDVLTLSATPIPRTLQMSMSGIRSLSLIETPPVNRFPIQTYVLVENTQIIKDAIYKELSRCGQVFILYNKISNMEQKKAELEKLVPKARIICAHGRMNKIELENVMMKFIQKEYDVLLCTTIIETGIDIPSVNTLIIMDADRFGLSQLYQIRGRVGRSDKIAYCYLMYQKDKVPTETAYKRLSAIKEFTELGSGFSIAMRDLSIRGAGDILGSEQAGFIDSVGIELFMQMLNEEIERQKGNAPKEEISTQPLLEVATTIDDRVVKEEELKIEIHKKINEIDSEEKLQQVTEELLDRFGSITEEMKIYMAEELFEKKARMLGINNIRQTKTSIEIFIPENLFKNIKVTDLFVSVTNIHRNFRFSMRGKDLIITLNLLNLEKHFVYYLISFVNLLEKI